MWILQFNILQSYKGNYIALTILKLNFAMSWLWAKKLNFMVAKFHGLLWIFVLWLQERTVTPQRSLLAAPNIKWMFRSLSLSHFTKTYTQINLKFNIPSFKKKSKMKMCRNYVTHISLIWCMLRYFLGTTFML